MNQIEELFGVAPKEIVTRLRFLRFSPEDEENVQCLHEIIDDDVDSIIDEFFAHLVQFKDLDEYLSDDSLIERLKNLQRVYLLSLGVETDQAAYCKDRLNIGTAHERIGLKQEWYVGAYATLFELISRRVLDTHKNTPDETTAILNTLQKVFSLDAMIVIEAYYHATTQRLERILKQLSSMQKNLEEISRVDELTGVSNRRHLFEMLEREIYRSKRFDHPFTFLFMDIDHFKRLNDEHGHVFGDYALREVARVTAKSLRPANVLGRFGGEEFAVGLVECNAEDGRLVAERLRSNIESIELEMDGVTASLTVSIGLAEMTDEIEQVEDLIRLADKALYEAKETGRNRVCVYRQGESDTP